MNRILILISLALVGCSDPVDKNVAIHSKVPVQCAAIHQKIFKAVRHESARLDDSAREAQLKKLINRIVVDKNLVVLMQCLLQNSP